MEGKPAVTEVVQEALHEEVNPKTIVLAGLTAAMETVGAKFEQGEYLIPDMLASAECVGAAMDILSPHLSKAGVESKGKFVISTVAGDLHDIGKNIVAIMLKGAGYEVIDLGTDVSAEKIVEAVNTYNAARPPYADRINVVGMCCTGNEVLMRQGVNPAGTTGVSGRSSGGIGRQSWA